VKREASSVPAHVAIIMDGNGRWAKRRALPRYLGHREGAKGLKRAVRYAANRGIGTLTVYAFSTENWNRPKEEVDFLLDLMYKAFVQEIEELKREGARVRMVGDRESLSEDIRAMWIKAEEVTADNRRLTLNVAFNYGGRAELTRAVRELAAQALRGEISPEEITQDHLARHLFTWPSPDPDLIIRTGGEKRLSNFLLWQAAYSELYVTDVLWPDFDEEEFEKAIQDYLKRERRFGQVSAKEQKE
jgi:undecaprenyl diphosphate synthase